MFKTSRTALAVLISGVILALGFGGIAVAGALINSADIKDNSVRSKDVRDGTLQRRDLRPKVVDSFSEPGPAGPAGAEGPRGPAGRDADMDRVEDLEAAVAALEDRVAALEAEDESGVNTNWVAKDGATIVDADTVRLTNEGTPAGASVEIANLDLPVQATKTVTFTYRLLDGAVYAAGSPRVFLEIGGTYYNTFDAAPADAGTANGDGSFTKTWTIPVNGRVGNAGVVMDSGAGTIEVSDLTISDTAIRFQ